MSNSTPNETALPSDFEAAELIENENEFLEHIPKYSEFIKTSFRALVTITKDDKEAFIDLYYNRDSELHEMKSHLRNIKNRGNNILISGHAGSGKSAFMYRVLYEIEHLPGNNFYPLIVDYNEVTDVNHLQKRFVTRMEEYFCSIGEPIHTLKDAVNDNIIENIHLLKDHLSKIEFKPNTQHLVILLDDFDYIEQELFSLLETFMSFGLHPNVTLILSARPLLIESIKQHDVRLAKNFTKDVETIRLVRLDIKKLIMKRLAIVFLENQIEPPSLLEDVRNRLFGDESPYMRFLKKMNISHIQDLKKIQIPFTGDYLNFITSVTNHNIRQIFDIIHDSLIYVLSNFKTLEVQEEPNEAGVVVERKIIPREVVMELFYDRKDAPFKLLNLHERKSAKKNSLYFNVLEAMRCIEETNDQFYSVLKKMGHQKKEVDFAVKRLSSAEFSLMDPRVLVSNQKKDRLDLYPKYVLTKKGNYYLSKLAYFEEYIERCGTFGASIKEHVDAIRN